MEAGSVAYHPTTMKAEKLGLIKKELPSGVVWGLVILLATLLGHAIQSSVHLNHDVSWIAHSARWLLEGRRFGVEVIDPNPPLIWWLSMPAALLVRWQVLDEPMAIRLLFWLYFVASAAIFVAIVSASKRWHVGPYQGWLLAFVGLATLAPAASFGQREYLSAILAMPYLAAAATRLDASIQVGRGLLVPAGVLAGLAFSLKPYFLATPLLIEGFLLYRLGWRVAFRTESVTLALTVVMYGVLVIVAVPQYLQFTVPLMRAIYWAFDAVSPSVVAAKYLLVAQGFAYGVLISLLARHWTNQQSVLLLAGAGYSASYFVQAKGFVYHAFPVLLFACTFLAVCTVCSVRAVLGDKATISKPLSRSLVAAMLLLTIPPFRWTYDATVDWYVQYNRSWGKTGLYRDGIIDLIERYAPSPDQHFFALSMHLYPGFPTASYTHADWSSRSATQGILSAYARREELTDASLRAAVVSAAQLQRRMVIEDMQRYPPSVVFLERSLVRFGMNGRQFDDLAFYSEDPLFRRMWSQYVEIAPVGPLRVFVSRKSAASPEATPAAR